MQITLLIAMTCQHSHGIYFLLLECALRRDASFDEHKFNFFYCRAMSTIIESFVISFDGSTKFNVLG